MSLVALCNTVWKIHDQEKLLKEINPEDVHFSFEKTSVHDLVKILRQLKASKAEGYDNIQTSVIKDGQKKLQFL